MNKKCETCNCQKTWNGGDIKCPFNSSDKFGDNWMCGLINKIRRLCDFDSDGNNSMLHYQNCDEQQYATINIAEIEHLYDNEETRMGLCLFVSWYKSRGSTEAMWILDENNIPRVPTRQELEAIVEYYDINFPQAKMLNN